MNAVDPRELAARMPDEPLAVDFRGVLLSRCASAWADEAGWVALASDRGLAVVGGRPGPAVVEKIAGAAVVLAHLDAADWLAERLAGMARGEAVLHGRDPRPGGREGARDPEARLSSGPPLRLRLVSPSEPFSAADFGPELEREWAASRAAGSPLAVAFEGDQPVAVTSSAFETEGYWDVSVDTLPSHRRRRLAAATFELLAAEMARRGKQPVWGAEVDNEASRALAARLGFREVGRLAVWTRGAG